MEDALVAVLTAAFDVGQSSSDDFQVIEAVTPLGPDEVMEHHRPKGRGCYVRTVTNDFEPKGAGGTPSYDRMYRFEVFILEPIRDGAARETRASIVGLMDEVIDATSNVQLFTTANATTPMRTGDTNYRIVANSFVAGVASMETVAEYNGS